MTAKEKKYLEIGLKVKIKVKATLEKELKEVKESILKTEIELGHNICEECKVAHEVSLKPYRHCRGCVAGFRYEGFNG